MIYVPEFTGSIPQWIALVFLPAIPLFYALIFHRAVAWVITWTMTAYLMGRSHNTLRWYREKIEQIPDGWRRMIPYAY